MLYIFSYLLSLLFFDAFSHTFQILIALLLLIEKFFKLILCRLRIDFVQSLNMVQLLFNVLLILLNIPLLSNPFISHLTIKLNFKKLFAFLFSLLSELLFLVMKKCVKFDNCIPFIIFNSASSSHLRENFINILLRRSYRLGGNRYDATRFTVINLG